MGVIKGDTRSLDNGSCGGEELAKLVGLALFKP